MHVVCLRIMMCIFGQLSFLPLCIRNRIVSIQAQEGNFPVVSTTSQSDSHSREHPYSNSQRMACLVDLSATTKRNKYVHADMAPCAFTVCFFASVLPSFVSHSTCVTQTQPIETHRAVFTHHEINTTPGTQRTYLPSLRSLGSRSHRRVACACFRPPCWRLNKHIRRRHAIAHWRREEATRRDDRTRSPILSCGMR